MSIPSASSRSVARSGITRMMTFRSTNVAPKAYAGAAIAAPAYAFGATFVLLKVIMRVMPLRATEREEALGMDIDKHGEEAYATGEGAILIAPETDDEAAVPVADPV